MPLKQAILKALGDQIMALGEAIDWTIRLNRKGTLRAIFFIFNKHDIHQCDVKDIKPIFNDAWAVQLAHLRSMELTTKIHVCTSLRPFELSAPGVEDILIELVETLRSYEPIKSIYNITPSKELEGAPHKLKRPHPLSLSLKGDITEP